jgi:hypothetical protein
MIGTELTCPSKNCGIRPESMYVLSTRILWLAALYSYFKIILLPRIGNSAWLFHEWGLDRKAAGGALDFPLSIPYTRKELKMGN